MASGNDVIVGDGGPASRKGASPFAPSLSPFAPAPTSRPSENLIQASQLDKSESEFVHNLMQLHSTKTADIMTPWTVVFSLPESMPLTEFTEIIEEKPFSRIPVYTDNSDDISGFVIRGEVLLAHLKDQTDTAILAQVKRPLAIVNELTPVDAIFRRVCESVFTGFRLGNWHADALGCS